MAFSTDNTVYVVTGGNRGIGLGLVKALLARPSTSVVATVRNNEAATILESETADLAKGKQSTLEIIQLDLSTAPTPAHISEAFAAVDYIDVLINNAGWSPAMTPASHTTAENLRAALEINTISPPMVFQALWPRMKSGRAPRPPKLVMATSSVGCITHQEAPGGAYGPSKAALNWLTRALHLQHEADGLIAVALHPGWVQTRMGENSARDWGFPGSLPETVDGSVRGMLDIVDAATRDNFSGQFVTYKGQVLPW